MNSKIKIFKKNNTDNNFYEIFIEKNLITLSKILKKSIYKNRTLYAICDKNVYNYHNKELDSFFKANKIFYLIINSTENNKNQKSINLIYDFLNKNNCSRKDFILAIGGGVVSDMVGFVSATYNRGLEFAIIPTTLLSSIDASIGGKNGYDYNKQKNKIGTFYNPNFVYNNISFYNSLPQKEFLSGLCEIIKSAIIKDDGLFNFLENNYKKILEKNTTILINLLNKTIHIKKFFIEEDPYDNNIRKKLNLGHTYGHCIESASNYKLSHGYCVYLGILFSLYLSQTSDDISLKIVNLFKKFGIIKHKNKISSKDICKFLKQDKKVGKETLSFIKISDIDNCYIEEIKIKEIEKAIEFYELNI